MRKLRHSWRDTDASLLIVFDVERDGDFVRTRGVLADRHAQKRKCCERERDNFFFAGNDLTLRRNYTCEQNLRKCTSDMQNNTCAKEEEEEVDRRLIVF